ncbi:hypothetical protein [Bacillus weihaiensis]|uniref:hypothetical protein n=1 Tax=Bacillus weihaiensis TaxID=1547283 RepID=UPI002353C8D9|nr:hypothetical protein [Bacillus weihaiensis]
MQQVKVLIEVSSVEVEEHVAYKLDEDNVVYYDENIFWLTKVVSTEGNGVYRQDPKVARVIIGEGEFDKPELVIQFIVDTAKRINFYDYLINFHNRREPFDFNILKFQ